MTPCPTWIKSSPITSPAGHLPHCIVIRHLEGNYHPFVVHMAAWSDGMWVYSNGDYCFTIEDALTTFTKRASG
jgi:hypothetical protein